MTQRQLLVSFRAIALAEPALCRACQRRTFITSAQRRAAQPPLSKAPPIKKFQHRLPETRGDEEFIAKPLGRPIGFPYPPVAGGHTGVDSRTLIEKKNDFVDTNKHREKRQRLQERLYRPYFMDFRNMKYDNGKAFLGNPKMFKGELSLFFPNFHGTTLESSEKADTAPVMRGRISVVNVFSSMWAQAQIDTFVGEKHNPAIEEILQKYKPIVQRVDVNVEENYLKKMILWAFRPSLRKSTPADRHGKYFMVTKGIPDEIRECIGIINSKVGYVYLVDELCRIRWAACADASQEEKETLARCLRKLAEESSKGQYKNFETRKIESKREAKATSAAAS